MRKYQSHRSNDPRQLQLPFDLPVRLAPNSPRTAVSPWGTPAPIRLPKRRQKHHPAFDPSISSSIAGGR
jgi:hypothetical protein